MFFVEFLGVLTVFAAGIALLYASLDKRTLFSKCVIRITGVLMCVAAVTGAIALTHGIL